MVCMYDSVEHNTCTHTHTRTEQQCEIVINHYFHMLRTFALGHIARTHTHTPDMRRTRTQNTPHFSAPLGTTVAAAMAYFIRFYQTAAALCKLTHTHTHSAPDKTQHNIA